MAALTEKRIAGRRIYLDANVFIYFLDGENRFIPVASFVLQAARNEIFTAVTGDAAVSEVMVGAYRSGDQSIISRFRNFFALSGLIETVEHDSACFDAAARLRGTTSMPLIDALHVATASQAGCDGLIIGDQRMQTALGVSIINLGDSEFI